MHECLKELIASPKVKVILIYGSGEYFCSGVDLKVMANTRKKTQSDGGFRKNWMAFHIAMWNCPKPTIGVLIGGAIAGGTALALSCDFLFTGNNALFHIAEVNFGMVAP